MLIKLIKFDNLISDKKSNLILFSHFRQLRVYFRKNFLGNGILYLSKFNFFKKIFSNKIYLQHIEKYLSYSTSQIITPFHVSFSYLREIFSSHEKKKQIFK